MTDVPHLHISVAFYYIYDYFSFRESFELKGKQTRHYLIFFFHVYIKIKYVLTTFKKYICGINLVLYPLNSIAIHAESGKGDHIWYSGVKNDTY